MHLVTSLPPDPRREAFIRLMTLVNQYHVAVMAASAAYISGVAQLETEMEGTIPEHDLLVGRIRPPAA